MPLSCDWWFVVVALRGGWWWFRSGCGGVKYEALVSRTIYLCKLIGWGACRSDETRNYLIK